MFGQPSINAIVSALREIEAASGGAASKPPRSNLLKVIEMLEKSGSSSVPDLVASLKASQATKKKKSAPAPANQQLVSEYLQRLQSNRSNPQEFARILDEIFKDKKIRLAQELRQIANGYTGGSVAFKTKLAARQAIERKHHGRWIADQYELKAS
mgnify:FL=1|tara:strand:+ start:1798 stop:2262 length:465 start_codon:yes stop_codon:yes gene_type:complete